MGIVSAALINVFGIRYSDASDGQDNCECQAGHDAHQDDEDGAKKNRGSLRKTLIPIQPSEGQIVNDIHDDQKLDNLCDSWTAYTTASASTTASTSASGQPSNSWLEWSRILVFLRILRVVRLIRLTRIYTEHHQVKRAMRQLVSQVRLLS